MTSALLLLIATYIPRTLAQQNPPPQPAPGPTPPAAPLRCQQPDGKPLPTATSCSDTMADCSTIFAAAGAAPGGSGTPGSGTPGSGTPGSGTPGSGTPGSGTPGSGTPGAGTPATSRPPLCDNPGLVSVARQCAKTCMICCETVASGCQDDPTYGIDCTTMKYLCQDPAWASTMSKACGATCGLCGATSCKDQIGACSAMKTMCRDVGQQAFMKQTCARTCGFCNDLFGFNGGGNSGAGNPAPGTGAVNGGSGLAGGCVDNTSGRGTDCARMAGYCTNSAYRDLMRQECPRTCGFCS